MYAEATFLDPTRHVEALALLAARHLEKGEFAAAFQYADRRCRIMPPGVSAYLLRAEASRGAGYDEFAAQDLTRALEADPTDANACRLALVWGSEEQKRQAARAVIADAAPEPDVLRRAIAFLVGAAPEILGAKTLFQMARREGVLAGWFAWTGAAALSLRVEAATPQRSVLVPVAAPERFDGWSLVEIETPDPTGEARHLAFLLDGVVVDHFAPPKPRQKVHAQQDVTPGRVAAQAGKLTIIMPVYEDYEATRACLTALFSEGSHIATRLIVIDDASPNGRLRAWLDIQAAGRKFHLIRNETNLGFAASVNRALALCSSGDVLLLNADTLPPPSSIGRLAAVAHGAPDVGTVTPLSNNGEWTSFPAPHVVNPLGSLEEVTRLDSLAQRANGETAVDLPNGIGFCLYVTRACLDAVGLLPEIYARGYYEDVEFCLRAREKGFRNVCAAGVYVGHAGARSFGAEKRQLVMRNLRTLERRFPSHVLETASFRDADPLQSSRGAIEALTPPQGQTTLLVCREGVASLLAREEAQRRTTIPGAPSPLICQISPSGDRASLRGVGDAGPYSLGFSLRGVRGGAALRAWLRAIDLVRIEIFDPLALPEALLKAMFKFGRPIDLVGADFEWAFPILSPVVGPCRAPDASEPCGPCAASFSLREGDESRAQRLRRHRDLLAEAHAIRPLDRMSETFARHVFREALVLEAPEIEAPVWASPIPAVQTGEGALAIVAPAPCALADRLTIGLARDLLQRGAATRIVVFGECVNDLAVMSPGNVFVAGKVETEEYERLFRQYEVSALMSPYRTRFFGRLDLLSHFSGLPKAYFDWTFGKMAIADGDLALDPRLCDAKAAALVAGWLQAATGAGLEWT